jgi:carbonic anhydrase/acetyltransferase-like protein (isoleucine patch superfamily)
MLIKNRGAEPIVDDSAFVAPTAVLVGRVSVGARARIMYGAVLDSEASKLEVGSTVIVCEHAVLRATSAGDRDLPVVVSLLTPRPSEERMRTWERRLTGSGAEGEI